MGYQVLARKYRPQRFADVAGQEHVTRTLMNALSQGRIAHGYIFSGHRGIGKTTIARIVAQALNCHHAVGSTERPTAEPCGTCDSCVEVRQGNAVDVIEIDAATNRGIDEIRELRDAARYAPARDRFKIYILDEAHQITDAAFNALLKTLEEPPAHVVFMMATTEPENIPQTIRSRCQHFSFHAVKFDDILGQLRMIATAEEVTAEDGALALLAEAGDGSMRDALSIMDQAIASAPVVDGRPQLEALQIRDLMGSVPNAVFERLLEAVADGQSAPLMEQINTLLNAGHSPSSLARQMVRYLRNCLMAKLGGAQTELLQISADERARASRTADRFTEEDLTRHLQLMLRTFDELNYRQEQRFHLELGLIKLVHAQRMLPLEELLSGVVAGNRPGSGAAAPARPAAPPSAARPTPPPAARPAAPPARPAAAPSSPFAPLGGLGSIKLESAPEADYNPTPQPISTAASTPVAVTHPGPVAVPRPAMTAPAEPVPSPFAAAAEPARTATVTEISRPVMASSSVATPVVAAPFSVMPTDGALAKAPEPEPAASEANSADVEALRKAIVQTLTTGGHNSAAQILAAAGWFIDGANLRIEVAGMGKKMIALTVNAQAEKIVRQELQRLGGPPRFMVVPGEGGGTSTAALAAPAEGSVEELALQHPLVASAKQIFHAEVRSIVDLRLK